ncbi:MAG: Gfo/Idh/MocA family oxidoreductase, partial [Clostridia bacterium]|nr:Gfo/Idh/MocA family oxidoreductase [Clostridia bacterium]
MKKKIRIAQIGVNRYSHATEIFETLKHLSVEFEIVGYAIVEDERQTCAKKLATFEGYPEMTVEQILNDSTIDAVAVETDEIHLLKYAQMVADSGKHIHMEKPGSQSLADFERLVETVRRNGSVFHLGYMYRYNPLIREAIRRAKAGEFGTIYSVEAHMSRWDQDSTREWFGSFRGGMMFYLGCHLIDLILQIQGMPSRILPLNTVTGIGGIQTEDLGFAVLQYPNATSFIRMGGTEVGGFRRRQLVICGSERTLEIKPLEAFPKEKTLGTVAELYSGQVEFFRDEEGHTKETSETSEHFGRYDAMMHAFAEMVRGERQNPYTLDYELDLFRVILQCCGL